MSEIDLSGVFSAAAVAGILHAADLDTGRAVGQRATEPTAMASVYKVPLLVEFARQCDAGRLDPRERVTIPADFRTYGPTGVCAMLDDVTLSLRDLAYLMIAVSDNTAADVLVARVGLDAVNAMLGELGLTGTRVTQDGAAMFADLTEDEQAGRAPRVLDPALANRTTPADMTRLLGAIWRDEAASAESCAWMRRLMGLQVWPHRLASGFPYDDVAVSGKTGTLPTLRAEVGVVEFPDGGRYAVAVFTRAMSPAQVQPRADAVIGTAARMAIDHLRSES